MGSGIPVCSSTGAFPDWSTKKLSLVARVSSQHSMSEGTRRGDWLAAELAVPTDSILVLLPFCFDIHLKHIIALVLLIMQALI
jgi:hypothetical protein